jgi:hypothetical protein
MTAYFVFSLMMHHAKSHGDQKTNQRLRGNVT